MDFDPSAFLAMDMTEDQDTDYTAPDVPQGFSPLKVPQGKIVVEGGLQMEQNVQISVPTFGLLDENMSEREADTNGENQGLQMEQNVQISAPMFGLLEENMSEKEVDTNGENQADLDLPMQIDTTENEVNTTPQHSPGERASSPCNKKLIQTTYEETRFRKDLFCGHYDRVKIFRLHCTICDRHLGCAPWFTERQMRMHKLLSVVVCRKCFEFYGDINFPTEEGSELFCCWCGQGGECFCCSTCAKIVCKKCIKRNFGGDKVKEIDKNDDWSCFVCKPEVIWPHRALMWGLQRWGKSQRQLVAMLSKEERQFKLSMDTSHCCLKSITDITTVGLPVKAVLSKIPLKIIALPYQSSVKVTLRQTTYSSPNNSAFPLNGHKAPPPVNYLPPVMPEPTPRLPQQQKILRGYITQPQHMSRAMVGYHTGQVARGSPNIMNRTSPYPMNRTMPQYLQPQPSSRLQYIPRPGAYLTQTSYRLIPPPLCVPASPQHADIIDLEMNTSPPPLKPDLSNVSALENGVRDIKNVLDPTLRLLKQFDAIKFDLANDFEKLTSFSEKLSYNIKIAICNLAKANTDLVECHRKFIDSRVSSVVNNIQSAIANITATPTVNETSSSPEIIVVDPNSPSTTPEPNPSNEQATPATPASSTGGEIDPVIALLCETVLEVGENKENKDDANRDQATPVKRPNKPVGNKSVKGEE